jgi:hypothetical protein
MIQYGSNSTFNRQTEENQMETTQNLADIGKSATSCIRDMIAALECNYDRLEELRDERNTWCQEYALAKWDEDLADELATLEADAGDCKDRDDAETRIQQDPLSIEFRTGWTTDRQDFTWDEACILLSTGGPAVRILVELENGEPHRAYLQTQDWGTQWTDYYEEGIGELLTKYVNVFCWE